jgi:hypothetical protein
MEDGAFEVTSIKGMWVIQWFPLLTLKFCDYEDS